MTFFTKIPGKKKQETIPPRFPSSALARSHQLLTIATGLGSLWHLVELHLPKLVVMKKMVAKIRVKDLWLETYLDVPGSY